MSRLTTPKVRSRRKRRRLAALTLCLATVVAGCGGSADAERPKGKRAPKDGAAPRHTSSVTFLADPKTPLRWTKKLYRTPAGRVELRVKNPSPAPHSVAVEHSKTCCKQPGGKQFGVSKTVSTGETARTVVNLAPGRYWAYCGVDGHWQGGMVSELIVE